MKRILFSSILVLSSLLVVAQGSKVTTAYNQYNDARTKLGENNLEEAVASLKEAAGNIDAASTHEKTMGKAKTWRFRGNIYSMIAGIESMAADYPDATQQAVESYVKAKELDTKGSYEAEVNVALSTLHDTEFNAGNGAFQNKDYAGAISHYDKSRMIYDAMGLVDSVAFYNAGLAADNGGLTDAAIENYLGAARIDYQAEYCYNRAITLTSAKEEYDTALEISKEAREKYPSSKDIIIAQLNVYLAGEKYEEAEKDMEAAAAAKPDDPAMWFALGVVKDNLKKPEEAEEAYLKSLEINPEYFNSNMNLAILYFAKASNMINEANNIPPKEIDKYNAAKDEAMAVLSKAVPYFEKAYEIRPDNAILMDLKEAYGQLGDNDNYQRVKGLLEQ